MRKMDKKFKKLSLMYIRRNTFDSYLDIYNDWCVENNTASIDYDEIEDFSDVFNEISDNKKFRKYFIQAYSYVETKQTLGCLYGCFGSDCSDVNYDNLLDGICPDCGEACVDGENVDSCSYSPTACETCGYSPCDQSC